jgi:hypothetical protein
MLEQHVVGFLQPAAPNPVEKSAVIGTGRSAIAICVCADKAQTRERREQLPQRFALSKAGLGVSAEPKCAH